MSIGTSASTSTTQTQSLQLWEIPSSPYYLPNSDNQLACLLWYNTLLKRTTTPGIVQFL